MDSSQQFQFPVISRLTPKTDPINSRLSVNRQFSQIHSTRICLDRNFRILSHVKMRIYLFQDLCHPLFRKYRRRPASYKNTGNLRICETFHIFNLSDQRFFIGFLRLIICRTWQKITIRTLPYTKRNMYIQFQFFLHLLTFDLRKL